MGEELPAQSYYGELGVLSAALEVSRQRGRVQGMSEMMVALASALGSLGTGLICGLGGVVALAVSGVTFTALLAVPALWLGRAHLFALAAKGSG